MYTVVIDRNQNNSYKFDCITIAEAKKEAKEALQEEGFGCVAKILSDDRMIDAYKNGVSNIVKIY